MSGAINMDGNKVYNLPTPTAASDAVPKGYADGLLTNYRTAAAQNVIDAAQDANIGIVITGSRPSMAVSAGQYVIVRGGTITGVTDGLYTAVNALSPSTDVTAADLTAVSGGGLNALHKDTGWIDLSNYITASFSARPAYPPRVRIINGVYYFSGEIYHPSAIPANQTIDAIVLPTELRPSAQITASGVTSSYVLYTMWISSTGQLQIMPQSGAAQQYWEGFQMIYFSGMLK